MHTGNFNWHIKYLYHLRKLNPKSSFVTLGSKDLWKKTFMCFKGQLYSEHMWIKVFQPYGFSPGFQSRLTQFKWMKKSPCTETNQRAAASHPRFHANNHWAPVVLWINSFLRWLSTVSSVLSGFWGPLTQIMHLGTFWDICPHIHMMSCPSQRTEGNCETLHFNSSPRHRHILLLHSKTTVSNSMCVYVYVCV